MEFKLKWSFSWVIQETKFVKNQGAMVGLGISFSAIVGWIIIANNVWGHYEVMVKYFKPRLNSSLKNYYWFLQYMDNDNGNLCNNQPPLKTHGPSLPLFIFSLCNSFFYYNFCALLYISLILNLDDESLMSTYIDNNLEENKQKKFFCKLNTVAIKFHVHLIIIITSSITFQSFCFAICIP